MPFDGLDERPAPIESGRMRKYFDASSGWPGPNSSPAKFLPIMVWLDPLEPCSTSTGWSCGLAERLIVQLQLGQDFAGVKAEVLDHAVAALRLRLGHRAPAAPLRMSNPRSGAETE